MISLYLIPHLKEFLEVTTEDDFSELRRAETAGRPLGAPEFVYGLENLLGREGLLNAYGSAPAALWRQRIGECQIKS